MLALFLLPALVGAQDKKKRGPPAIYVLLLDQARTLDAAGVTKIATKALGLAFVDTTRAAEKVTKGTPFVIEARPGEAYMVGAPGVLFTLESRKQLLWKKPDLAAKAYPNARSAITGHKAILTVQAQHAKLAKTKEERRDAYAMLGKLTAALLDEHVLALYCDEGNVVVLPEKGLGKLLAAPDPVQALRAAGVPNLKHVLTGDPAMEAAIARARKTFPDFARAFAKRAKGQPFMIKIVIRDAESVEHIWVEVESIDDGVITGRLGNQPILVKGRKRGDRVTVKAADISDWMYMRGDTMVGGYTVKVLEKRKGK